MATAQFNDDTGQRASQGVLFDVGAMGKAKKKNDSGANLGFEAKLWLTADKMHAPYKGRVYDPCCGSAVFVRSLRINAVLV